MLKRLIYALVFALASVSLSPAQVLDQESGPIVGGNFAAPVGVLGPGLQFRQAQTFTVGLEGILHSVAARLAYPSTGSDAVTLSVCELLPSGAPDFSPSGVLGSATRTAPGVGWIEFSLLSEQVSVRLGQQLALVVTSTGAGSWDAGITNYSAGQMWSDGGSGWSAFPGDDLGFRTYVFDPEFQMNGRAELAFDGVQSDGNTPATSVRGFVESPVLSFGGAVAGLPAELVISTEAPIGKSQPGAAALPGGTSFNIDLGAPTTTFFQGGLAPSFNSLPPATLPIPPIPACVQFSVQMIAIDFAAPFFLSFSQAGHLVIRESATFAGPTGDDSSQVITLPACNSVMFYGTAMTELNVASNGRVTFGAASTGFEASVASALSGPDWVGFWTDLAPNQGGTIDIVASGHEVSVNYHGVRYFNESATASFRIVFSFLGGEIVVIDSATMVNPLAAPGTSSGDAQLLGLSKGGGAANDPGAQVFTTTPHFPATASDALYDFFDGTTGGQPNGLGLVESLQNAQAANGMIRFTPMPIGGAPGYAVVVD